MQTSFIKMIRCGQVTRWAVLGAALACIGCKASVPSDWSGLKSAREEQKILKLAKRDPFPSPADVGLDSPTSVP